jgi:diguanylate cyclase (GGDEF)-like protein
MVPNLKNSQCTNLYAPLVLIVDDQEIVGQVLQKQLENEFRVFVVHSGKDAIEFCLKHSPDLILLDVLMPGMDGVEVCNHVKKNRNITHVPIIFLTGAECSDIESRCWDAGCVDFLSKPVSYVSLIHRVKLHLAMKARVNVLDHHSRLNTVTQDYQRNWYIDFLERQCGLARLRKMPMSLVMLKIQDFDQLIQSHGWPEIDECLTALSNTMVNELIHSVDVIVRYRRDKFLCILPDSGPEATRHMVFMLQRAIAKQNPLHLGDKNHPPQIAIAGITKLDGAFNASTMLHETENCLAELSRACVSKVSRQVYNSTQTLLALAG